MIEYISKKTGVPVEVILGRERVAKVVCVRQIYWKLLREKKHYTFREIAYLTGRDTSTVHSGISRINDLLETGDDVACGLWGKFKEL